MARPDRPWRYVLGLVAGAPFLAETVASANTPAVLFPIVLPLYVVVYGCPALLLRELWVRGRLTGARLLWFGVAYTAFNEGVVAATWFKLSGSSTVLSFTAAEAGSAGGVNWAVAVGLVVFHTAFSLMAPVTLAQSLAVVRGRGADRRPWLGRRGALVCLGLIAFVVLGSLTPRATAETCAGPALATCTVGRGAAALLIMLVGLALFLLPPARRTSMAASRNAPALSPTSGPGVQRSAGGVGRVAAGAGFGLAFFGCFFLLPLLGLPAAAVAGDVLLLTVLGFVGDRWCRPERREHRLDVLLVLGALIPGMLASLAAWRVGQPLAALIALAFLRHLLRQFSRSALPGAVRPWPTPPGLTARRSAGPPDGDPHAG